MNATFTGINIASRGAYTSQAAMSVVANNTSNAGTKGYCRQIVNQRAIGEAAVYGGRSILGNGPEVTSVSQCRDPRMDGRYWQENTRLGAWNTKANALTEMEAVLNTATSSSGFNKVFEKFYNALEGLNKSPGDSSRRNTTKETGQAICQYLNESSQKLSEIRQDKNCAVKTAVDQINSYAQQIADLNGRIGQALACGATANELKDQRGVLIDQLSKLTDISVTETTGNPSPDGTENKKLAIRIHGITLVDGSDTNKLEVVQDSTNDGMYSVRWQETGEPLTAAGGQLKAELDLRDGDGTNPSYKGAPYYIHQLDKFAQTFAKAFNEGILAGETPATKSYAGHAGSYLADGMTTGIRFFSFNNASSVDLKAQIAASGVDAVYQKITAASISLSKDIGDDVQNIAAASSSGGKDNAENMGKLLKLLKDSNMFNKGTPEDFYSSIISTLATDSSTAQNSATNATSLVKTINDRRLSVSGVESNEETANMTLYQGAYRANSKMISIWSEIYAQTINMVNI